MISSKLGSPLVYSGTPGNDSSCVICFDSFSEEDSQRLQNRVVGHKKTDTDSELIHLVHESCLSEWADRQIGQMRGRVCVYPCPGGCGENYRFTRPKFDALKRACSVFSEKIFLCFIGGFFAVLLSDFENERQHQNTVSLLPTSVVESLPPGASQVSIMSLYSRAFSAGLAILVVSLAIDTCLEGIRRVREILQERDL